MATNNLESIANASEWSANLDVEMPIRERDIPGFEKWINWNSYNPNLDRDGEMIHNGYDFAAYYNSQGECVLGLPAETVVRAIADGVASISTCAHPEEQVRDFYRTMILKHNDAGLASGYAHIIPLVEEGQIVKKGDPILKLYKSPGSEWGRIVHLHFYLGKIPFDGLPNVNDLIECVDPCSVFGQFSCLDANPQNAQIFEVPQLQTTRRVIAHFR
ncbi:MAG: M23 family metallopeptidase [Nanoarchaeota archaeon]|nr:M23 family metallopeptidase [Nanoarchaeota archaeon]